MTPVSILISNYHAGEALELTIESIQKRTAYKSYKIIVLDSSKPDSRDRTYLQSLKGQVELLETDIHLKHGEAVWRLLNHCKAPLAIILDSDVLIRQPDWLDLLIRMQNMGNDGQLGVAVYQPENAVPCRFWRMPRYLPMCALLNMETYRSFMHPDDWMEAYFPWKDCQQKELFVKFNNHPYATVGLKRSIEDKENQVFGDTGWRFCERVNLENKGKYHMHHLSYKFYEDRIKHWGAISIYNADPENPQIKDKLPAIQKELEALRNE